MATEITQNDIIQILSSRYNILVNMKQQIQLKTQ